MPRVDVTNLKSIGNKRIGILTILFACLALPAYKNILVGAANDVTFSQRTERMWIS